MSEFEVLYLMFKAGSFLIAFLTFILMLIMIFMKNGKK